MKTAVLGSGGWGTALALVLLENGNDVKLWSYFEEESKVLQEQHENPMLKGVPLPEALGLTSDLSCVKGCPMVVLATPSFAVRTTARSLKGLLDPGTVVVSVSKGIEKDTSMTLTDVIEAELGPGYPVVALCGPSHAEEVGRRVPTAVVSASKDQKAAELVQDCFMNSRFRVYTSPDIVGFGDNTKSALMTRGLTEIARLGMAMGGKKETFAGLTGVGDLIVTCTSMHSRNRRCGILIGQGVPVEEALKQIGAVVEGYYATATGKELAEKLGVEMPITEAAYSVLYEGKDPRDVLVELMTRAKKHEIEDSWV